MKRSISLWQLMGFAITSLGGTILHYLYDLSGQSVFAAPFSGVNESTWEHMKLLFFPMFVFALVQSLFFKGYDNFWCVKLRGILLGLVLIPVIFYTYNGVFGKSPDWFNITIFFISAAVVYLYETRLFINGYNCILPEKISFVLVCIIGVMFIVFTFATPTLPIFQDPITGAYGII